MSEISNGVTWFSYLKYVLKSLSTSPKDNNFMITVTINSNVKITTISVTYNKFTAVVN
jgi:hypothetical protein